MIIPTSPTNGVSPTQINNNNNNQQQSSKQQTQNNSNPTSPTTTKNPPRVESESNKTAAASSPTNSDASASTSVAAQPYVVIDKVIALYDFNPTTPEAIGFPKDAVINILDKSGDWWYGEYNGKSGILPYNYVQSIVNQTNG